MFSRVAFLSALVIIAIMTTSCGGDQQGPAGVPATSSSEGTFPITVRHALGEITIKEKPERIVTLGEDLDTLAALGIVPVAYAPTAPGFSDDVPYLKDRIDLSGVEVLDGMETGEFSVEQIAAARPDLILASNFYGIEGMYASLSKIAPTLAYEKGWGQTSWQDMSTTIGKAVGQEDAARAAVAETDQYLAELKAELPGLEGKTIASAFYHSSGTFAANPSSASMSKYEALGMEVSPKLLEALPEGATDNSVSLEKIDVFDVDVLFLSFGSVALQDELEANPLYRNLNPVQRGTVSIDDPTQLLPRYAGNNPTLLNIVWMLESQRDVLTAAAR